MRPDLRNILQERFQGHEADVDPGIWDAIRSQIGGAAPVGDRVEDLFRQRFQEHEVNVDPGVWNAISSQIGQGVAAGTTVGGGGMLGWASAGLATLILSTGIYLYTQSDASSDASLLADAQEQVRPVIIEQEVEESIAPPIDGSSTYAVPVTEEMKLPELSVVPSLANETNASPMVSASQALPTAVDEDRDRVRQDPPERIESRLPGGAVGAQHDPYEATMVVQGVMQQLKGEVYLEAQTAGTLDPKGPPAVDLSPDLFEETGAEKERTNAELPDIFMPNTFTPNGDGINDTYRIDRIGFKSMMIRIYSLQNNKLVFSTDTNEEWDGANGEKGYYLVAIEAVTDDGRLVTKGKAVWLNTDHQ